MPNICWPQLGSQKMFPVFALWVLTLSIRGGHFSGSWSPSSTKNLGFLRVLCTDLGASPCKASAVCLTLGWPLQVCRAPEGLQQRGELPHIFHWLIFDLDEDP